MKTIKNDPNEFNKPVEDINKEGEVTLNPIINKTADGESVILDQPNVANKSKIAMQVKSKGSAFPMIQPNQNMPEQFKNRAGRPMESNMLTNDPNINQPMEKVPATNAKRENMFGSIASNQGTMNPVVDPSKSTQQASIFPQAQSSFGNYANPARVTNRSFEALQQAGDKLKDKMVDTADSMASDGMEFNEGLKKASAEGKLDDNPKFKAAVDSAPGMYSDGPSKRSFKAFDHAHTKVTKGNLKATERDDAAHMDYLKRDIKYDDKHGGSKKQMLDDEKHISKLAGDLKYDAKKKRKYDNV